MIERRKKKYCDMRRKMSNAGQTLRTILVLSEAMKWHVQNMPQNSPWGALTCWQYISMHSRETMQEGFIGKYEIASTSISPWTSFVKPLETFLWRSMTNHKAQSDFYNVKTSLQWRWDKAAVAVLLQAAYRRRQGHFYPQSGSRAPATKGSLWPQLHYLVCVL